MVSEDDIIETVKFVGHWLTWVELGAVSGMPYHRRYGLCDSVLLYTDHEQLRERIQMTLIYMWTAEGLYDPDCTEDYTPFGYQDYCTRYMLCTQHQSERRLEWCKRVVSLRKYLLI